ncbi:hypothetical protein AB3U99_11310 [Niallia sp. JL1B1071]|uniref:hypothetical protein n=1 Tax=Niallia tiangongensis TaxID=3237105 RepID=UPI0037DD437E
MTHESNINDYDKRVESIDEKICELISQRKLISSDPGDPTSQHIATWSKKYNLNEDFLNDVFSHLPREDRYKPIEEPKGFLKNIPVLKSFEDNNVFYSVTFIRQYENASLVHLNIDKDISEEKPSDMQQFTFIELSIEESRMEYDCRNNQGGGSGGHISFNYIVTPPLPEDTASIKLKFKEYNEPFNRKPTGLEFVFTLDK